MNRLWSPTTTLLAGLAGIALAFYGAARKVEDIGPDAFKHVS